MKKLLKEKWFPLLALLLTLTVSLFWVALRINYSGISKFLGADTNPTFLVMNLPLLVCAASWLGFALSIPGLLMWPKRKWPAITALAVGIIMTGGAIVVILFGARDYMSFILPHFYDSLLGAVLLLFLAWLLFFPLKGKTALKAGILLAAAILAIVIGYELRPCHFTYGAVVYAVEDDYQIVFSTSDSAVAWVEIGGECYYDLYAGSSRSRDRVHKITVPQTVLDAAGSYTTCAQQMIYRGPFGGYKGNVLSKSYAFHPVDSSDGLNYVSLSDVHSALDAAVKSAGVMKDMDYLVLIGDLISMVESEADAQTANRLAHAITGGSCPVIYARGNHEIKGEYAEDLYKYVGSLNQSFAYTVTLGNREVFALVLDIGEDHEDDWWEYYGTAHFELYQAEQTRMIEEILASADHESYLYTMVISHIPIVHIDGTGYFREVKTEWTSLLNQMSPDIALSGHKHKLFFYLPGNVEAGTPLVYTEGYAGQSGKKQGGTLTDHNFPAFLVGRRSLQQAGGTQDNGMTDYVGLHTRVDLYAGTQSSSYVNSLGETITVEQPFEGNTGSRAYTEIVTDLQGDFRKGPVIP